MDKTKHYIKNCCFCNTEFRQTQGIKMKKQEYLNNKPRTTFNNNIIRCCKCHMCFSCSNCQNEMKKHYNKCSGTETGVNVLIYNETRINFEEFQFILLPEILGGFIVNVLNIIEYDNYFIYKFKEIDYIMIVFNMLSIS
jgi:hypothetical protein